MAGIAGRALIHIAGDFAVFISQFNGVVVLMAFYAAKG